MITLEVISISALVYVIISFIVMYKLYKRNSEQKKEIYKLNKYLNIVVKYDPVSGAYNYNYFTNKIKKLLNSVYNNKTSVAFLQFDIHNLDKINMKYGYHKGDELLKTVYENMSELLDKTEYKRYGSIICRPGGSEFLIIISKIDKEFLEQLMTDMIHHIRGIKFYDDHHRRIKFDFKIGSTISYGRKAYLKTLESNAERALEKCELNSYYLIK